MEGATTTFNLIFDFHEYDNTTTTTTPQHNTGAQVHHTAEMATVSRTETASDVILTCEQIVSLTACERLLATPELFEMILLELPMQTLLVNVQRICKEWSAFLESSLKLQQAMFFKPITDHTLRLIYPDYEGYYQLEETPQAIFSHPLLQGHSRVNACDVPDYEVYREVSPEVKKQWEQHFAYQGPVNEIDINHYHNILYRTESSWRKQLATQPPVDIIEHDFYGVGFFDLVREEVRASGTGVTIRDMVQETGTLHHGTIDGGKCWTAVDWSKRSTYNHMKMAITAKYDGPWWVKGSEEAQEASSRSRWS